MLSINQGWTGLSVGRASRQLAAGHWPLVTSSMIRPASERCCLGVGLGQHSGPSPIDTASLSCTSNQRKTGSQSLVGGQSTRGGGQAGLNNRGDYEVEPSHQQGKMGKTRREASSERAAQPGEASSSHHLMRTASSPSGNPHPAPNQAAERNFIFSAGNPPSRGEPRG